MVCAIAAALAQAQTRVPVTLKNGKLEVASDPDYTAPVIFTFDHDTFAGKTITFFSSKNEVSGKIASAKFGSSDLGHKTEGDKKFFEVSVNKDLVVDLQDNTKPLTENKLYLKLDDSDFSSLLKIKAGAGSDKGPNTSDLRARFIVADALMIADLEARGLTKEAMTIMEHYGDKASLSANHFLHYDSVNRDKLSTEDRGRTHSGIAGAIGGLDVTNLADGFAKFIVKRTKEELSISFFMKFKAELEKSEYSDLKILFPATHGIFQTIDKDIYNYSTYINSLREAFRDDLKTLDEHFPGIVDNNPRFFQKDGHFIYGAGLKSACFVVSSLRHNMHPGDILQAYPTQFLDGASGPNEKKTLQLLKGYIQTLQLLSESLQKDPTAGDSYWAEKKEIGQLVGDKNALQIYLGLVIQRSLTNYGEIVYAGNETFYKMVNTKENANQFNNNFPLFKQFLLTFSNRLHELTKLINDSEKPASDSLRIELYAKFFKSTAALLEFSFTAAELPYIKDIPAIKDLDLVEKGKIRSYFKVCDQATDLVTAVNRKRYAEVVNHAVSIYEIVVHQPATSASVEGAVELSRREKVKLADNLIRVKNTKEPVQKFMEEDPVIKEKKGNTSVEDVTESKNVVSKLLKYGAFMASMVNAKNSDEIAEIIESAALPAGSARIKRETYFNVALNAYCGAFLGKEKIGSLENDDDDLKPNVYGVTAPIGFSVNFGKRGVLPLAKTISKAISGKAALKNNWSHSLFISVIDIGTLAAFRFQNSEVKEVPSIEFKDIISPGIFWSIGFPKTPISLNLGAQVGPNLREVTADANRYADESYVRYSAAICVDIPLLNLYTRSEKP